MRTFTALICCLYMLAPTSAIAQQGESCDANPRWLLVTVVRGEFWMKPESGDTKTEHFNEERLQLVDRCHADIFTVLHYRDEDENIAAEIRWAYMSDKTGEVSSWSKIWVKESLQDICRVMRDCEDATSRP